MTENQSPDDSRSGSKGATVSSDRSSGSSEFGAGLTAGAPKGRKTSRAGKSAGRTAGKSTSKSTSKDSSSKTSRKSSRTRRASAANDDGDERPARGRKSEERPAEERKARSTGRKRSRSTKPKETSDSTDDRSESKSTSRRTSSDSSRTSTRRKSTRGKKRESEPVVGFLPDEDEDKTSSRRKSTGTAKKKSRRGRSSRDVEFDRSEEPEAEESAPRRRKRTSRSKKATKSRGRRSSREEEDELEDEAPKRKAKGRKASSKKSTKRASKRGSKRVSDDDELDEDEESGAKKKRKRTATRKKARSAEEIAAEAESLRTQTILVNAADPEERRVVLIGDSGRIEDLLMTAESQKNLVGDIYRGKVVNLEPAIGAAFVDFGQGRNGFLHTSDVMPVYGEKDFTLSKLLTTRMEDEDGHPDLDDDDDDEPKEKATKKRGKKTGRGAKKSSSRQRRTRQRLPISDLLKVGDQVVVQVTKDAIGDKGPTLTTYISIPGRYLVLMPSMARTGVSRKIPDENERRRLKRILAQMDAPEEMGVIVRTAGVGKLKTDLKRDLNYLLGVWKTFEKKLNSGRGPTPLYQESDVATRTLRDLFNKHTKEVIVDDFAVHEQMCEFAERLMPEHTERIKRYEGQRPLFHDKGIEQDFELIFNRRVELPSGGSIVFDQAEALVAIDVNSGRTRTNSNDFEEIALKTNLEAVPEIALQIRLRDLGGIIVCDFIDMMKSSSNRAVERALRSALSGDRARSKLGRIGQFGLLEMTRQRLGPGTHKKVFQACPRCRGTARIRTVESRAQAILRRLGSALTQKGFSTVEVRAHPEVVQYIKDSLWDYVRALEHRFERELKWTEVPDQAEDSVLRYLRTDGREVRPGGRRKR